MRQVTETWGPAYNNNNNNIPQAITLINGSSSSSSSTSGMNSHNNNNEAMERITRLASENAVVIFSISTCCMCHAIKRLFCGMGVNPTVHELDHDPRGNEIHKALIRLLGSTSATGVPVVFVGGQLVGPMDRVMASHINGSLVPLLKEAGALWL